MQDIPERQDNHPDWDADEYSTEQEFADAEAWIERNPRKSFMLLLDCLSELSERDEDRLMSAGLLADNRRFWQIVWLNLVAYIHERSVLGELDIER